MIGHEMMPAARTGPDGLLEDCCRQSHSAGMVEGYVEGHAAGRAELQAEIHADAHATVHALARVHPAHPETVTASAEALSVAAHDRRARGIARFRADHERRRREVVA